MASSDPSALLKELQTLLEKEEHKLAIAVADKVLKSSPKNKEVILAKVGCLLHTNAFDQAIKILGNARSAGSLLESDGVFESAYAYYRLGRLQEASDALKQHGASNESLALLHLEAQIEYKLGNFERSLKLYENIVTSQSAEDFETLTNLLASSTLAGAGPKALEFHKRYASDTHYELTYNAACAAIELGEFQTAAQMLNTALEQGIRDMQRDGLSQEEIDDELAIVRVQIAYLDQVAGKHQEASDSYNAILKLKPSDSGVIAVASNNLTVLRGDKDLFDSAKRLKTAMTPAVEQKLTQKQLRSIRLNNALILIYMNKYDAVKEVATELQNQFPSSDIPPLVLAALHFKENRYTKAVEVIRAFIDAYPNESIRAQLTLAQLQLNSGKFREAIATLQASPIRFEPGVVSTLVSLYVNRLNDKEAAERVLDESVQYWLNKKSESDTQDKDKDSLVKLLQATAQFKFSKQKYSDAGSMYEHLVRINGPTDKESLAGLVRALSYYDIEKAELYAKQLPQVDSRQYDAEALESVKIELFNKAKKRTFIPNQPEDMSIVGGPTEDSDEEEGAKMPVASPTTPATVEEIIKKRKKENKKKKKLRKLAKKLGDKFNSTTHKPDPERWIRVRDRPSVKRARKKKEQLRTQGSQSSSAAKKLAASATTSTSASTSAASTKKPSQLAGLAAKKRVGRKK